MFNYLHQKKVLTVLISVNKNQKVECAILDSLLMLFRSNLSAIDELEAFKRTNQNVEVFQFITQMTPQEFVFDKSYIESLELERLGFIMTGYIARFQISRSKVSFLKKLLQNTEQLKKSKINTFSLRGE